MGMKRRDFLKGLGTTTAILSLDLMNAKADESDIERWDMETDVAVVGYGAAGASTAITLNDMNVNLILLEKQPKGREGG